MTVTTRPSRFQDLSLPTLLLVASCALVVARPHLTGSRHLVFMLWNLFLACVPLFMSSWLRRAVQRRASDPVQAVLLLVWLLFLPNAPYLLTDLVHLRPDGSWRFWYDFVMLVVCAITGLLLGYLSLYDVHELWTRRFGSRSGWFAVATALLATGYGIYLGRVQRWNSWDVLANPQGLFAAIGDMIVNPGEHLHIWGLSLSGGLALLAGYAGLCALWGWRPQSARD